MRMAELSRTTGVPVATIKYYQREQLLHPAEKTGPTQSVYDDTHVRRLQLILALVEVGKLAINSVRSVLTALDSDAPLLYTFDIAQQSVSEHLSVDELDPRALARADEFMEGWRVSPANPGRLAAAHVMQSFDQAGQDIQPAWFARYAESAMIAAQADLDEVDARAGREAKAEIVVVGTVLGDAMFSGFRRAAQEHVASERYAAPPYPVADLSKEQ